MTADDRVETARDACALPLMQRIAAMLDRDPGALGRGDPMPRGWHVGLFAAATPQSRLRPDGLADLGAALPDLGLPRIVMGGRRTRYRGDVAIGCDVRRDTRTLSVAPKQGRSGRLAVVTVEHRIFAEGDAAPAIVEEQDYVLLEERPDGAPAAAAPPPAAPTAAAAHRRDLVPDEALLFRYCAITFNAHRIHYDLPYAAAREGYPALVVNGGIPVLFLLDMFRAAAGREPAAVALRNLAPLFCGRPIRLLADPVDGGWRLWAEDDGGRTAVEATVT